MECRDLDSGWSKYSRALSSYSLRALPLVFSHISGSPPPKKKKITSNQQQIFVRRNPEDCKPYVSKMRSWCDTGDIYCDSGNDEKVHVSYTDRYTDDATEFVVSLYQQAVESKDCGPAPPSPSPTMTATSTNEVETTGTGNGDNDNNGPVQVSGADGARVVVLTGVTISLMVGVSIMLAW